MHQADQCTGVHDAATIGSAGRIRTRRTVYGDLSARPMDLIGSGGPLQPIPRLIGACFSIRFSPVSEPIVVWEKIVYRSPLTLEQTNAYLLVLVAWFGWLAVGTARPAVRTLRGGYGIASKIRAIIRDGVRGCLANNWQIVARWIRSLRCDPGHTSPPRQFLLELLPAIFEAGLTGITRNVGAGRHCHCSFAFAGWCFCAGGEARC